MVKHLNILLLNYLPTYRLKSKGPACLLKVKGNKTLVETQIQLLNKVFENPNIVVLTGFKHKKIKSILDPIDISTVENVNFELTNDLYNISLAISNFKLSKSILILPGNILLKATLFNNFNDEESQLWLTNEQQELGCIINEDKIQNVMWTLSNYWSNISYFTNREFELLEEIAYKEENINKLFLFEAINSIIDAGGIFKPIIKKQKIQYINKISDVK